MTIRKITMKGDALRIFTVMILIAAAGITLASETRPALAQEQANIKQMVASAKTPADHEAIAKYYDQEGAQMKSQADQHREIVETYQNFVEAEHTTRARLVHHCEDIVKRLDAVAKDDEALAKEHREMAVKLGGSH